ncbi:putative RNA recognition motif domain, nucleotide-binding alpha-beta plait domain superfamily [Helianthus annuus]|nr:putative RNA recognition motif domain, nucleotide-binding alpha-beta plait domain superfamily [Helianthus annuus]
MLCYTHVSLCIAAARMQGLCGIRTGRSRGFGFVSFRDQQDAQSAINDLMGKWLGSRQIRCNWGTKGAGIGDEKQASDSKSVVELTNGSSVG